METQPLIEVSVGQELKLAEGSTMVLEGAEAKYPGKRSLQIQWEVVSGNPEKIEIQGANEIKARITLGNLEQPEEFTLRLKASDGLTEATKELKITGFPSKLGVVNQIGGALIGIAHMGDKWVAARGRQLQIYSSDFNLLEKIPLDFSIKEFFALQDATGKGAIFVQSTQGSWVVVQHDPVSKFLISRLPMMGQKIRRVVPFTLDGQPFVFGLLERNLELWNLSAPRKPRLKSSLTTQMKNPLYLAFKGRHVFIANESTIETLEFSTGKPVASVPSGGSITALETYSLGNKQFLLAAIGRDRTDQNRMDYGLRIFEITPGGRLGQEKRVTVSEGAPVEKALVIPGVDRALLSVWLGDRVELKIFDLKKQELLPLSFEQKPHFIALEDFITGKIGEEAVAAVADGNQLRVFSFQTGAAGYTAKEIKNIPGIMSAAWVKSSGDGSVTWVGDEGTPAGGALAWLNGQSLSVTQTDNSEGSFPAASALPPGGDTGFLLYVIEDPLNLEMDKPEGGLGIISLGGEKKVQRSELFLGVKGAQGELRPLGIAAHQGEDSLKLGVAVARISGAMGGSGILIWEKPKEQSAADFLSGGLQSNQTLIPLQDARDLVFTPDGKAAIVASGVQGIIAVDLEKKNPVSRMSLGSNDWIADRVLMSHGGQMVLASFLQPASRQVIVKIFGIQKGFQMQEWGTLTGLSAVESVEGIRAPRLALTDDDLYLFVPMKGNQLKVLNLSNPARPFEIISSPVSGEIRAISLANKFKDIFVALGSDGIAKLEFGF